MPKKINSTKASLFSWALVIIGFIILTAAMTIMIDKKNKLFDEDGFFTVGSKQFKLIEMYHKGEAALLYVDQAAKLASSQSLVDLGKQGGNANATLCGDYLGYSLWIDGSSAAKNCFPDAQESFKEILQDNLNKRLNDYPETSFPENNYIFSLSGTSVIGIALEPINFIKEYVPGIGNPNDNDNKIQQCNSGDCVAERAKYYAHMYDTLPYVYGGESPYSYEMSIKDQVEKGPDSIFYGISLTKYQPAGSIYTGRITIPGFDCTGLVWWILKHSGINTFYRDSAHGLNAQAQSKAIQVCAINTNHPCTKNYIRDNAKLRLKRGEELTIDQQVSLDLNRLYVEVILELLTEFKKDINEIRQRLRDI